MILKKPQYLLKLYSFYGDEMPAELLLKVKFAFMNVLIEYLNVACWAHVKVNAGGYAERCVSVSSLQQRQPFCLFAESKTHLL